MTVSPFFFLFARHLDDPRHDPAPDFVKTGKFAPETLVFFQVGREGDFDVENMKPVEKREKSVPGTFSLSC